MVVSILHKLKDYEIAGYTDIEDRGPLLGVPYIGPDAKLTGFLAGKTACRAILAVGQVGRGDMRQKIHSRLFELQLEFPAIISPHATVNEAVIVNDGTVVMDGAVINSGAQIGFGAILNTNSTIEHDTEIGDWVHICPGATLSGAVKVGARSIIGAGAVIIEGKTVASDCIVGAGAVVIEDLAETGVYVGCPARRIR